MPTRLGLQVQPQHADFAAMRRTWQEADALGVDAIFTWDHFYPLYGERDGKHFEGLTTLASLAEATSRAQVGGLVFCNSYRNPELLADAHRTVDHISGGRAILGIGAGWFERDYDEYGYEFGTAPSRLRDLRDALPRIHERLGKLNPPLVGDLPIMIGGGGEKVTLKLVAQHAQMWNAFGDLETYRHKAGVLARHCADLGRDPAEIEHTWLLQQVVIKDAEALAEAGVGMLIAAVGGDGSGYDLSGLRELVAWRERVG